MKKQLLLFFIITLILFSSCGDPIRNSLADIADDAKTVEIHIDNKDYLNDLLISSYQAGKPLYIFKNDSNSVAKLFEFISDETTPEYKCSSHGFFRFLDSDNKPLLDLQFNVGSQCRHFSFTIEGKTQFRKMTPAGVKYLSSILKPEYFK